MAAEDEKLQRDDNNNSSFSGQTRKAVKLLVS